MNRLFRLPLAVVVIVLLMLPLWGKLPKRPFQWVDDENAKPLIYRNSTGESAGIFYDIVTEVFRRMDIPLKNRLYPWSRAQKMVEEGEADGMVTIYTKSRQKFLKATDPVLTVEERVFVSRDNPRLKEIQKIRSIDGLKRFILAETTDAGWSKENLKDMKIVWVPTAESAINMVAAGRVDIYLMSNYSGPDFVKDQIRKNVFLRDKLKKIVMGSRCITKMQYRLLIRKDSSYVNIIGRFNEILHQMYKDGTVNKIIQRYHDDLVL